MHLGPKGKQYALRGSSSTKAIKKTQRLIDAYVIQLFEAMQTGIYCNTTCSVAAPILEKDVANLRQGCYRACGLTHCATKQKLQWVCSGQLYTIMVTPAGDQPPGRSKGYGLEDYEKPPWVSHD